MILKNWLRQAKKRVGALDAELIALKMFGPKQADRSFLVAHDETELKERDLALAERKLRKREAGVPLAYVLGEKEFYGRMFRVNSRVLIPRPETEALIELVKGLELPKNARFLEIGTGSGCIAVTLALEFPQSYVLASDVSVKALDVAKANDVQHEGRIELTQSNLLKDLYFGEDEHFDVLVANLPYVNRAWKWVDEENLHFEPSLALYARGENGLSMYRRLFADIKQAKCDERNLWLDYVVVEADPCQHAALKKLAKEYDLVYLKTEGYGMLFEDSWRYWYDARTQEYSEHKTAQVLAEERQTGEVKVIPEQLD